MSKKREPKILPLIAAIADALAQLPEVGLLSDDGLSEQAIKDRLPLRLAAALKDGVKYTVVMGLRDGDDFGRPIWDWMSETPSKSSLRGRARDVADYCQEHGLDPYFVRGPAAFGKRVQMLVPVDAELLNRLLTAHRIVLGGDAFDGTDAQGPVDIDVYMQVSAQRREQKLAASVSREAKERMAALARAHAEANEKMAQVRTLLRDYSTAGKDAAEIMYVPYVEYPDLPQYKWKPEMFKPQRDTAARFVWDRLISELQLKPVLGQVLVHSRYEPSFYVWAILIPLRPDFVPVTSNLTGPC